MLSLISYRASALLLGLNVLANIAYALPEDRTKAVNIEADRARLSQTEGQTVYTGNVKLNQGSLEILADEVVITMIDGVLGDLVASGQQASFRQLISLDKPPVIAHANSIYYDIETESLKLEGDANIVHGDGRFEGNRIEYLMSDEKVMAEERVKMTLPTVKNNES